MGERVEGVGVVGEVEGVWGSFDGVGNEVWVEYVGWGVIEGKRVGEGLWGGECLFGMEGWMRRGGGGRGGGGG